MSAALPDHYYIDKRDGLVSIWSTDRLPFQPKGWKLALREDIKAALLSTLSSNPSSGLYAALMSPDSRSFDMENVLFYNVGTGIFSPLCRNSICFERFIGPLPKQSTSDNAMRYLCEYQMIPVSNTFHYWRPEDTLAEWKEIPIPSLKGELKPHTFWYAMKKAGIANHTDQCIPIRDIGLSLRIQAPKNNSVNLAAVMKPLIDGVISSMHWESQIPSTHVLNYLSMVLNEPSERIAELLSRPKGAVLGPRPLVHPFQRGIQWNPADDALVAVQITFEPCQSDNRWLLSGSLFTSTVKHKSSPTEIQE